MQAHELPQGVDIRARLALKTNAPQIARQIERARHRYSTVTLLARLRGWSTSVPRSTATW